MKYLLFTLCLLVNSLAAADIISGLEAHYKFDGNAIDSSGKGNAGVLSGGVGTTTDRFGNSNSALLFDGSSGSVATPLFRESFNTFTFSTWFKFGGAVGDFYHALTGSEVGNFFIGKDKNTSHIGVQDSNYFSTMATGTNAWDGNWHHLVMSYNNGNSQLYLDGVAVGSPGSFGRGSGRIHIAFEPNDPTNFFKGAMDDVRYYSRSLSADDAAELFVANPVPEPSSFALLATMISLVMLGHFRKLKC